MTSPGEFGYLLEAKIRSILEVQGVKTMMENQKGRKVKVLVFDNGGEYTSTKFKAYLVDKVIKHLKIT